MIEYDVEVLNAYTYIKPRDLRGEFTSIKSSNIKTYRMYFVTSGKGEFKVDGKTYHATEGDCFLYNTKTKRDIKINLYTPLVPLIIHFNFLDETQFLFKHKKIKDLFFFREILNRILSAHQNNNNVLANNWLNIALVEFFHPLVIEPRIFSGVKFEYMSEIGYICSKIVSFPEKKWEIEKMANDMFISKQHFYRLFKELRGCFPRQFITKIKMKKAENLLIYSSYCISEISDSLGYLYRPQFCSDFKRHYSITPSDFRSKFQKKNVDFDKIYD